MARKKPLLTKAEKALRRSQKKADAINAKAIAEAGMFAEVPGEVVLTTAAEQIRRTQMLVSGCVEGVEAMYGQAANGLHLIRVAWIERYAATILGPAFEPVRAKIRKTYPSHQYWSDAWKDLLVHGKRVVFGYVAVPGMNPVTQWNPEGKKVVETGGFPDGPWTPPLTPEQFTAMFPTVAVEPDMPEHDDGGLFQSIMKRLTHGERHGQAPDQPRQRNDRPR